MKIIAIGAAVQDVFLSHSDEFKPVVENPHESFLKLELGAKADVNKIDFCTGGGATNAATTFARQGIDAAFIGSIGNDPAGEAVMVDLDRENVDTARVVYNDKYATGYSVLLLAPNGERTILTYRGASTHYSVKDFDITDVEAEWVYISSFAGNMKLLTKIIDQAKSQGMKVMLNPGKKELEQAEKLRSILEDVDVLSLNKEEIAKLVEGETLEELTRHALHLVPVVIISDGPNGVMASDGKTIVRAGMYEDVPVVDRTGAGDAFGSGFLCYWAQGKSLKDSITFASANSTSVVGYIGAKTGILKKGVRLHDMPMTETQI